MGWFQSKEPTHGRECYPRSQKRDPGHPSLVMEAKWLVVVTQWLVVETEGRGDTVLA
jgi:hypothetical protein